MNKSVWELADTDTGKKNQITRGTRIHSTWQGLAWMISLIAMSLKYLKHYFI